VRQGLDIRAAVPVLTEISRQIFAAFGRAAHQEAAAVSLGIGIRARIWILAKAVMVRKASTLKPFFLIRSFDDRLNCSI